MEELHWEQKIQVSVSSHFLSIRSCFNSHIASSCGSVCTCMLNGVPSSPKTRDVKKFHNRRRNITPQNTLAGDT